jgi:hypothetical protein
MFPVCGGKCLSRKAVHNRIEKFSQPFRWWRRFWNRCAEMAETTVKRLLRCEFRRTGKAMRHIYQCLWRICREINVFTRFEYHMFYVLYQFVTNLLTVPRNFFKANFFSTPQEVSHVITFLQVFRLKCCIPRVPMHATPQSHIFILDLIILMISDNLYGMAWSSSYLENTS